MCFILFIDITSFYLLFHLGLISSLAFVDWYFSSNLRKITAIISSNITYLLYYPSFHPAAAAAKSLQSCPTLCDPIDGRQPTRLPHPWDSPGKNTGVGCHFLLQCMKVKSESEDAQLYPTLSDPMDCSIPYTISFCFPHCSGH